MATTGPGRVMLVAGACIGNFLEFYSFLAYAYFAPMIGDAFFPDSSGGLNSLLRAMLVFAAGFVARPLGAVAIGRYAARHGRQQAMMLSFLLMASGLALLAATPPARMIGAWAPLLILLARIVQGFSEGGEIGPVTALLFDAAPPGQGGLYGSLQYLTQLLGSLAAVSVGLVLSLALSHAQLYAWGWRVPFALGLVIIPAGFALRRIATALPHASPAAGAARPHAMAVALIALTVAGGTISTYLRHFGVSYAISVLHLSSRVGMLANVAGMLAGLATVPLGWWVGLRSHHLRGVIGTLMVLTGILSVPLYRFAIAQPGLPSQLLLNCSLFALSSLTLVPLWQAMLESLPSASRVLLFGFVYATTVSLFGGFTPSLVTWLIQHTGDAMMAGYLMALAYGVQAAAWYGLSRFDCRRHA
ncbi:MFS transporter [Novacetimonas cocois]|nr:MFS transporter [Novacetimonas cocois]